MHTNHIKARILVKNWIDGTINGYNFQAIVYDDASKFGINNGRINKLEVWDENCRVTGQGAGTKISYERGWYIHPSTPEEEKILQALIEYFANFPTIGY